MFLLGFYDVVVGPPYVPIEHDHDAHGLLQLTNRVVLPLDDMPSCLRQKIIHGQDDPDSLHLKLEGEVHAPELTKSHDDFPPEPARAVEDMQPAFIHELRELWTHHATETRDAHEPDLRIDTWYLDYPRYVTCHESRSVRLGRDFTTWLRAMVSDWHDKIDTTWPINIIVVRPVPATTALRRPNVNVVIVLQRSLHGSAANHFTVIDSSRTSTEQWCFTGFAPQQLDKRSAIVAADISSQCEPQDSRRKCMIWHEDTEIADPIFLRNRHGLTLLCIIHNIPIPINSNVWEEEIDDDSLIQLKATPRILQLDTLIKTTTAVRIISGSVGHLLPSFLEVELPGCAQQVQEELRLWGHDLLVYDCEFWNTFLCLQLDSESSDVTHYVFLHDDPLDTQGTIFHSSTTPLTQTQIMEFLCGVGYPRAVVLNCTGIELSFIIVNHKGQFKMSKSRSALLGRREGITNALHVS